MRSKERGRTLVGGSPFILIQINTKKGRIISSLHYIVFAICANIVRYFFLDLALLRSALFCPCHPERSQTPNAVRSKRSAATFGIWDKKVRLRFASLRMTGKIYYCEHCALSHYNINRHSFAFSFDTRGAKEKALQKEKRRFSLSLFEKSSAKTFLDRSLRDVQSTRFLWVSYVCALIGCRLSRLCAYIVR